MSIEKNTQTYIKIHLQLESIEKYMDKRQISDVHKELMQTYQQMIDDWNLLTFTEGSLLTRKVRVLTEKVTKQIIECKDLSMNDSKLESAK